MLHPFVCPSSVPPSYTFPSFHSFFHLYIIIVPNSYYFTQSRGIHLADERGSGHHHDNSEDDNNEEGLTHQLSLLSLQGPHPLGEKVHLDTEGNLVWPVIFLYPEYGQTDFIAAFSEHHR